jgi:ATP-dependent DNA helicase RecG
MVRLLTDVGQLLDELARVPASSLEDQDLDFKRWDPRSLGDSIGMVVEMAVCMANGGGGTVVFGVDDRAVGRVQAILGVPLEVDPHRLKRAVYDRTDPRLTPEIDTLIVPEGTGRLLVMQVHGGLPPYTDSEGRGKIRVGTDCQPLTGTLRRRIAVETGESDLSGRLITGRLTELLSAAALEQLRDIARRERAPSELLDVSDVDLLTTLGLVRDARLTLAGLLLAGRSDAIAEHAPGYVWTHARMRDDTSYVDRADGRDALPVALERMLDRIMADNPIETVVEGVFHHEYRTYPDIALREALLNALCHRDFALAGPTIVKQYPDRLEIANPGGFIGGVSPDNILHHAPVARNPLLVEALVRLRLINRMNLGVQRMFAAMLAEGKPAPSIAEPGDSVTVTFQAARFSTDFWSFVQEEALAGRRLDPDHLLVLHHLLQAPEIDIPVAARLCQRSESEARDLLTAMETSYGYLERGGAGRGTYWSLRSDLHRRIGGQGHAERDRRISWEAAKTRILDVLLHRHQRGEPPLTNTEIREIARLDRVQVKRLMNELRQEGHAQRIGERRLAGWISTLASGERVQ